MDAQSATAAFRQNSEVASGLSRFHNAKRIFLSWNLQIRGGVTVDLQKNIAVGPAFVGLPSGVQEPRAESENCSHFFLVADCMPDCLQNLFILRIHRNVAKEGKVVAGTEPREVRFQNGSDTQAAVNRRDVFLVGEKLDAARLKKRNFGGQLALGLVFTG